MTACINHPLVEAGAVCQGCAQPYCDACLVEFLGARYCGPCRNARLAALQGQSGTVDAPLAGTNVVDIGGWLTAGWQIVQPNMGAFIGASLVLILLSILSCAIAAGALQCGMYMLCWRVMSTGSPGSASVFDGFRRFLWAFLLVLMLGVVGTLIGGIISAPYLMAIVQQGPEAAAMTGLNVITNLLSGVVSAVLEGMTFMALPHIAATNANPVEALQVSWAVFRRNPIMWILCAFVFQLVMGLGACACGVGVLVTFAIGSAARAKAYADHFGIQAWQNS